MVLKFSQRKKPFHALQSILSLFNLEIILTLMTCFKGHKLRTGLIFKAIGIRNLNQLTDLIYSLRCLGSHF